MTRMQRRIHDRLEVYLAFLELQRTERLLREQREPYAPFESDPEPCPN